MRFPVTLNTSSMYRSTTARRSEPMSAYATAPSLRASSMSGRRQVAVAEHRVPPLAALPRPPMQDSAFDDLYERGGVAIPHFVTAENLRQFHLWNWFVTGRVVDAWQKARDNRPSAPVSERRMWKPFELNRHVMDQSGDALCQ